MAEQEPKVGVIMGSDSDLPVMIEASRVLRELEVPHEVRVISAHRTPDRMAEYAKTAEERGLHVIIAGAGGSAHLPGMTAAHTILPVIGVPIDSKNKDPMTPLLSIVNMPPGVPVATVGVNGARNAGLLAVGILAVSDKNLSGRLKAFRRKQETKVFDADESVSQDPEAHLKKIQ